MTLRVSVKMTLSKYYARIRKYYARINYARIRKDS